MKDKAFWIIVGIFMGICVSSMAEVMSPISSQDKEDAINYVHALQYRAKGLQLCR